MQAEQRTLQNILIDKNFIYSDYLEREVEADVYLPAGGSYDPENLSLLLINDGQDLAVMDFEGMLNDLWAARSVQPLIAVGIYCGPDRKLEYGTAFSQNFRAQGSKAGLYTKFIFDELLPYIRRKYNMPSFKEKAFAGFSLGGLSALDIVWNHASEFSKAGLFSPSLWWRRKGYEEGYDNERDRLMHLQVRKGTFFPWLRFFIECGTEDETADRNNNGVIDSIDDALDLILELKAKGYTDQHIKYLEVKEGKHDVATWGKAFPSFLKWAFGRQNEK
jgi:enterochelin esterase-like enzyme